MQNQSNREKRQFTHGPRITSIHGILLPPKKRQISKKYITLRFALLGTVPSKKNMIWADNNLYLINGSLRACKSVPECLSVLGDKLRSFIRNSKKYTDWFDEQKIIVARQLEIERGRYEKFGLVFPLDNVSIKVYHYWADNIERDLTNKLDSINDLFVDCGVISNDNWQTLGKIESESELYKGEILQQITTVDITQRLS